MSTTRHPPADDDTATISVAEHRAEAPPEAWVGPSERPAERVAELEGAVQAHERRLEGLVTIASNLGVSRDPARAMRAIVAKISELLEADRTTIYELRPEENMLWGLAVQGEMSTQVGVPVGQGVAGLVAARGRPINLKDAYLHPAFDPKFDKLTGYRTRSMLCVPMRNSRKQVIGVVQVLNKQQGYFTVEDERLLMALANQAAITLEALRLQVRLNMSNAELKSLSEDLQQRVREQDLLLDVERAYRGTEDPEVFARQILAQLAVVARAQAAAMFVPEENGFGPVYIAEGGQFSILPRVEIGEGVLGKTASRGKRLILGVAESSPEDDIPLTLGEGCPLELRDVMTAPLSHAERILGSVALINRQKAHRRDLAADQQLMMLVGSALSQGVADMVTRREAKTRDRLMTIGQMLGGVLHDLKGPMAVISGYTQFMADQEDPETRHEMADTIRRQIAQFNDMTREVMAFVRGERTVFARPVDIRRFLKRVRESLEPEFTGRGVDLEIDDQSSVSGWFDEPKIMRVITNIARNARQAMGSDGTFTLSVADADDGGLRFALSDNGPGIPEHLRDRLFELFTTSGKKGGTGLGLAIVKRITEDHGGTVNFTTETGRGTTFEVYLPPQGTDAEQTET
ncbi:MAG: GAF domain-containing protein [Bradymonadia bacterium]